MPGQHSFEHLPLILREQGRAKLKGGGKASPQTIANENARRAHSASLATSAQSLKTNWEAIKTQSAEQGVPIIPHGVPILLRVDPRLDLDVLCEKFEFGIVAEQEEGYVIVAAEDIELTPFIQMVNEFAVEIGGSAKIAEIHRLFDNPADRLRRILRWSRGRAPDSSRRPGRRYSGRLRDRQRHPGSPHFHSAGDRPADFLLFPTGKTNDGRRRLRGTWRAWHTC
jgi:hypothetical protein